MTARAVAAGGIGGLVTKSAKTEFYSEHHHPLGTEGLWHHEGLQLPAYIQNVAKGLMEDGHPREEAIPMAIGTVKRWAAGGGKVTPEVQAASAKAVAEWEALKASHGKAIAAELLKFRPDQLRDPRGRWTTEVSNLDLGLSDFEPHGNVSTVAPEHGSGEPFGMFTREQARELAHEHRTPRQAERAKEIGQSFGKPDKMPHFKPIKASQARGNSRPVSAEEFQQIALEGHYRLQAMKDAGSHPSGLHGAKWDQIKQETFSKVQQPWGGATIDSHTGQALPDGANRYALTIKGKHQDSIVVPEGASQAEFDKAMDNARKVFAEQLRMQNAYLGVFHDDDQNRIDIDPVVVVDTLHEVETIGAATHAVGGAYNFADGNGYWPPHVADTATKADKTVHYKGPGHWRREAEKAQREDPDYLAGPQE